MAAFQYLPHLMKGGRNVFDRFAVLFSVIIVWIYAHLLTVGGAYKNVPLTTQLSCRTDRAGIIGAAPWWEKCYKIEWERKKWTCLKWEARCCRIRVPYPFQWGAPSFHAGESFAMMATSFVALVEVSKFLISTKIFLYIVDIDYLNLWSAVNWCFHCCVKVCECNSCTTFCS